MERGEGDDFSFSITPANGKLAELKVDKDNWDGSAAVHFKEDSESPYDTTVNFEEDDMEKINEYSYVYIGEHIHTGGIADCENPAVCEDCDRPYGNALGHNVAKTEEKEATCTEDGNIEYWYCNTCGKYFSDEALTNEITKDKTVVKETGHGKTELKNAKEATCTAEGYTGDNVCTVCGETLEKGEVIPKLAHNYKDGKCTVCETIDPDFKAVITKGANGEWQKGTEDGLSFTSNAAFADFQKVQVDGKDLEPSNYDVKEGSTIVTLKASYLETLTVGKHTLAIFSDTGTAETEFTIKAAVAADKVDTNAPQTGDSSNMALWIALLFVSSGILSALTYTKKKQSN